MANGTIYIFQWINFVTVCFIHFQYHEEDLFSMGHRTKRFFQWSGKMGERF